MMVSEIVPAGVIHAVMGLVGAAFFLGFIRLIRGPSLPDRAISLDLMAVLAIGFMAVEAVYTGREVFLVAAMVLSLVMFLGTIAFALYIQRGLKK